MYICFAWLWDKNFISANLYSLLSIFFIAGVIVFLITPVVRRIAIFCNAMDHPKADDRRIHTKPIPRWGGIALYIGIICSIFVWRFFIKSPLVLSAYLSAMLVCGGLIILGGVWDDIKPLRPRFQAIFLFLIGILVQYISGADYPLQIKQLSLPFLSFCNISGKELILGNFAWPITALYIFVAAKTMDTIDGIDGLAVGLAGIGALALAVLGIYLNRFDITLICLAIIGSCVGFFYYNFNPAVIFMGTGGAQLLGFMLACISIAGFMQNTKGLFIFLPLVIFSIPFFDACSVIVKRLVAKQPISQGDRRHVHHTLMRYGLNQRQTALLLYMIALLVCTIFLSIIMRNT